MLAAADEAESDGTALEDAFGDVVSDEDEAEAEADDEAVDEDVPPLVVAVGVGVELAEGLDVPLLLPPPLGEDGVEGAEELADVLGVVDGVVSGWVVCVVVDEAGVVSEASGSGLVLCVPGRVAAKAARELSEASGLTDVLAAAVVCVPAAVAPVPVVETDVAATLTGADGVCAVTGTDIAEACAGWLAAVEPRVIAAAAAAMPSTPTELRSTPLVGCTALNVAGRPVFVFLLLTALGVGRACRAPVLLSRIAFPSRSPGRKSPP